MDWATRNVHSYVRVSYVSILCCSWGCQENEELIAESLCSFLLYSFSHACIVGVRRYCSRTEHFSKRTNQHIEPTFCSILVLSAELLFAWEFWMVSNGALLVSNGSCVTWGCLVLFNAKISLSLLRELILLKCCLCVCMLTGNEQRKYNIPFRDGKSFRTVACFQLLFPNSRCLRLLRSRGGLQVEILE